jgi:apolipoprotein N-acyltransferase
LTNPTTRTIARAAGVLLSLMVSAGLMAFAIDSPGRWWLGWFSLLPLFHVIRIGSPRAAMGAGSFWGLCLFLFAVGLFDTQFSATWGSILLLVLIPGAYAFLGAWLTRRIGFSAYLLALGWIGVEFALRPLGLHHGLLAGTQGDDGVVIRVLGSFAGYVLVAFLVAYVNASLLSVLDRVQVCLTQPRLPVRSVEPQRRFFLTDLPNHLFYRVCHAQPRAPPWSGVAVADLFVVA